MSFVKLAVHCSAEHEPMEITHRIWMGASAVALVAAVAVAAIHIRAQMTGDNEIAAMAPLDPACDIQMGSCEAIFPDGSRVSLTISPRPIQALKPLQIQVTTEGLAPQEVEVDFRGLGMNMGYNRPRLKRQAQGRYSGSGMLAICVMERMSWEATVLARTDDGVMAAPFRFDTKRQ